MSLMYCSTKSEAEGHQILNLIKKSVPGENMRMFRTLVGLAGFLKNFRPADVALLLVADEEELASLLSLKKFLQRSQIFLVLPDRSEGVLRLSAHFSPLLACFKDSDFSEVTAMMGRLRKERLAAAAEIDPQRYRWTGEVPYIPSSYVIPELDGYRFPEELPLPA